MTQPVITLAANAVTLTLDPDLQWRDEFEWFAIQETVERGLTGALIIDRAEKVKGRPITLAPPSEEAAWQSRATITQLQAWESDPALTMTLSLRGETFSVQFRRHDGAPFEAQPVVFVADPLPGGFGDWYLVTLRLIEV